MLEFLIMIPFALVIILGIVQLTLVYNAHTMMKLAAFNAARAAIVAKGSKPEDPATVEEGLSAARRAARVTLLPVIPAFHGMTFTLDGIQSLLQNGINTNSLATGSPALQGAYELGSAIKVEFLNRNDAIDAKAVTNWPRRIDFDDPLAADDNVIKVRVSWDYPLVIPYINRIMTAIARPDLYLAYNAATGNITPEMLLSLNNRPAWDYANFMARGTGNATADAALHYLILRWPMRTTAIMRAQWDRRPN